MRSQDEDENEPYWMIHWEGQEEWNGYAWEDRRDNREFNYGQGEKVGDVIWGAWADNGAQRVWMELIRHKED